MNSLERTRNAMRGRPVDRIPVFPILIAPACELTGTPQGEYSLDPEVMADTLIAARDLTGSDGIYVSRDNWVYHEALGGGMTFPEDDEPNGTGALLDSVADFRKLQIPDPETSPGMKTLLAAARKIVREVGKEYYVQANIDCGPFSLAAVLRGPQAFLMDLATESESRIQDLLEFCTEVVVAYGKAMLATGVHGIQYGDSTASLISAEQYRTFALPYQEQSFDALSGSDCDLWLHICGKTDHLLHFLRDLNIQGFEVDALVDMEKAGELLGEGIALKGNLDTTFLLQESADAVHAATRETLRALGRKTGIVMSPGCGVPRMTPLANLRAMVRACEDDGLQRLVGSASPSRSQR